MTWELSDFNFSSFCAMRRAAAWRRIAEQLAVAVGSGSVRAENRGQVAAPGFGSGKVSRGFAALFAEKLRISVRVLILPAAEPPLSLINVIPRKRRHSRNVIRPVPEKQASPQIDGRSPDLELRSH